MAAANTGPDGGSIVVVFDFSFPGEDPRQHPVARVSSTHNSPSSDPDAKHRVSRHVFLANTQIQGCLLPTGKHEMERIGSREEKRKDCKAPHTRRHARVEVPRLCWLSVYHATNINNPWAAHSKWPSNCAMMTAFVEGDADASTADSSMLLRTTSSGSKVSQWSDGLYSSTYPRPASGLLRTLVDERVRHSRLVVLTIGLVVDGLARMLLLLGMGIMHRRRRPLILPRLLVVLHEHLRQEGVKSRHNVRHGLDEPDARVELDNGHGHLHPGPHASEERLLKVQPHDAGLAKEGRDGRVFPAVFDCGGLEEGLANGACAELAIRHLEPAEPLGHVCAGLLDLDNFETARVLFCDTRTSLLSSLQDLSLADEGAGGVEYGLGIAAFGKAAAGTIPVLGRRGAEEGDGRQVESTGQRMLQLVHQWPFLPRNRAKAKGPLDVVVVLWAHVVVQNVLEEVLGQSGRSLHASAGAAGEGDE